MTDVSICKLTYELMGMSQCMDVDVDVCVFAVFYLWHDSFMCTWLMYVWGDSYVCDMTHSYETWLIYMWHDSYTRDMTHSYVRSVTWLLDMYQCVHVYVCLKHFKCDMTHLHVTCLIRIWHDSFIRNVTPVHVTWLIHTCYGVASVCRID